jgi:N-acetylneuraminate synthase
MEKIFYVAEVGINANGDINIAKKLIDMAVECKCDAVKFQKRTIDKVYKKEDLDKPRESPWGTTQRQQKEGLEFGKKEYNEIDSYCKAKGIEWFASAWDIDSLNFLKQYNLKYNKVASVMLTNLPFVEEVAKQKKTTFISTAMSTYDEIDTVVNIFKYHKCPFILMHCVGLYPCPDDLLNLSLITNLKERYNCQVGYSGHSPGIWDTIVATVLGARYIEKHITLDRTMYGSDQPASLEKKGLETVVTNCNLITTMLGNGEKKIIPEEQKVRDKMRYW